MIKAEGLTKNFRTYVKRAGFAGSVKSFFKREYRHNAAVDHFDLHIEPGEFVGLLGPNGAGKTTLMKMFTGIIVPSEGQLSVGGYEPFRREIAFRKDIALVMGQKSQLWWDIPAMDSFLLLQRYYEIEGSSFKRRLNELAELLGVTDLLEVHVRKLSLGERMKMELMASLLHEPSVIFLDEPTIGLDLVAQRNIRQFLAQYQKERGTTIILTSHYMADVEALCDRIVLILGGKKRYDGPLTEFEQILGREKFVNIRFDGDVDRQDPIWEPLFPNWHDNSVDLRIADDKLRTTSIEILTKYPVVDFSTEKMPVERVMETLITRPELIPES